MLPCAFASVDGLLNLVKHHIGSGFGFPLGRYLVSYHPHFIPVFLLIYIIGH
jgi:hypothetical protein